MSCVRVCECTLWVYVRGYIGAARPKIQHLLQHFQKGVISTFLYAKTAFNTLINPVPCARKKATIQRFFQHFKSAVFLALSKRVKQHLKRCHSSPLFNVVNSASKRVNSTFHF